MTWQTTNTAKGDNKLYSDARGVVPSLDLRFASQKNLNDYITGQNLITFSRPVGANQSPGTYVDENGIIQLSSADTPRFDHDPTTGESLGLLIEESRTNLLAYSQAIGPGNDNFGTNASTVTQNAAVSPDGTTTATSISGDVTYAEVSKAGLTVGAEYTFSFYVKTVTKTSLQFGVSGVAGAVVSVTPNEWNRVSITFTTVAQFAILRFYGAGAPGEPLLVWGAQLEAGSFPTSYIPTTGTALARSADVASITGSNFSSWYNQSEGTIFGDYGWTVTAKNLLTTAVGTGTNGNNGLLRDLGTTVTIPRIKQAVGLTNFSVGNVATPDNQISYVNGSVGGLAANIFSPTYPPDLQIGRQQGSSVSYLNGTISRLTYFPERLPDATLQAITA